MRQIICQFEEYLYLLPSNFESKLFLINSVESLSWSMPDSIALMRQILQMRNSSETEAKISIEIISRIVIQLDNVFQLEHDFWRQIIFGGKTPLSPCMTLLSSSEKQIWVEKLKPDVMVPTLPASRMSNTSRLNPSIEEIWLSAYFAYIYF